MRVIVLSEKHDNESVVNNLRADVADFVSDQVDVTLVDGEIYGLSPRVGEAQVRRRHPDLRRDYDCTAWPAPCNGKCRTDLNTSPDPAVPAHWIADGEILVDVDKQGLTTDLKKLGVHPGGLFLAHKNDDGSIVLEPCRIERINHG